MPVFQQGPNCRWVSHCVSVDRVAMFVAFGIFRMIHENRISPDAQSPYGCSWHEHYKNLTLKWLAGVTNENRHMVEQGYWETL